MRSLSVTSLLLLLFFCSYSAYANEYVEKAIKKANKQTWYQAKTDNFTIVTDRNKKYAFKLAEQLEKFRAVYFLLSGQKNEARKRVKILATKNKAIFKSFFIRPDMVGDTVGIFRRAKGNNYSIIDISKNSFDRASSALFSTYSFYITANYSRHKLPYWFRQGLAYYLGELQFKGNKSALLGFPENYYLLTLHNSPLIPLDQLLAAKSKKSFKANYSKKFPAQVWLLTHYLYSDADRTKQLHKYLLLKRQGANDQDAVAGAFSMTIPELEQALKKYLKNKRVKYFKIHIDRKVERELNKYLQNKNSAPAEIPTTYLDYDEPVVSKITNQYALNYIGEILAIDSQRHKDAEYIFDSILKSDPENVTAMAQKSGLLLENDFAQSKSILDKARKIDAENPLVAKISGLIYKTEMQQAETPEKRKQLWNKAVRNLNRAINAEDIDLEALYHGAKMYMQKERWQKASELLDVALYYAPNETDFQLEQIICLYQLDKKDQAEAEYQRLMANMSGSKSTKKQIQKIMDCLRNQNCD